MLFIHFIFFFSLLLLPSICLSFRVFSNKSPVDIWWSKYWSFSFSISPFNGYLFSQHQFSPSLQSTLILFFHVQTSTIAEISLHLIYPSPILPEYKGQFHFPKSIFFIAFSLKIFSGSLVLNKMLNTSILNSRY